jgi:hypothetical protein
MLVNCQQGLTTGLFYRPAIRPRPRRTSSSIVFAWLAAIIVTVSQAFLTLFFSIRPEFQTDFLGAWLLSGVCNAIDGQLQSQGLVACESQSPVECSGRRRGYG